jgi:uridine phosphorylase
VAELYHLGVDADDVPACAVVLEAGIAATPLIEGLVDVTEVGAKREFRSTRGRRQAVEVLVVAAGIGAPSAAIAMEELARAGCLALVWIGRCWQPESERTEAPVVPSGAVRLDGTSRQYAPLAYPALPEFRLSSGLRTALGADERIVETTDVISQDVDATVDRCSAAWFVVAASRHVAAATVLLPARGPELVAEQAASLLDVVASHIDARS